MNGSPTRCGYGDEIQDSFGINDLIETHPHRRIPGTKNIVSRIGVCHPYRRSGKSCLILRDKGILKERHHAFGDLVVEAG